MIRLIGNSLRQCFISMHLQWAAANGVLSGKGSGENLRLDAFGNATRAECAAMLRTFLVKFESESK